MKCKHEVSINSKPIIIINNKSIYRCRHCGETICLDGTEYVQAMLVLNKTTTLSCDHEPVVNSEPVLINNKSIFQCRRCSEKIYWNGSKYVEYRIILNKTPVSKKESTKKESPRSILANALQRISDEFGICFTNIRIDWMDVSSNKYEQRAVNVIDASCAVIDNCK